MNNRVFLILIVVLSCVLLLVGVGMIGAVVYWQADPLTAASFATPVMPTPLPAALRQGGPQVGDVAPDFAATALDGTIVKLSDFLGKPIMINFWASWCGPCTAEMKNIEAVYQKHTNDDFVILAVNQGEGVETIKGYGELWKLNFRLLRDPDDQASRLYNIRALPTTVFIDRVGKVYEIHIGGPMTIEFIEKRVEELLGKGK